MFRIDQGEFEKDDRDGSGKVADGVCDPEIKNIVGINVGSVDLSSRLGYDKRKHKNQKECNPFCINGKYSVLVDHRWTPTRP